MLRQAGGYPGGAICVEAVTRAGLLVWVGGEVFEVWQVLKLMPAGGFARRVSFENWVPAGGFSSVGCLGTGGRVVNGSRL